VDHAIVLQIAGFDFCRKNRNRPQRFWCYGPGAIGGRETPAPTSAGGIEPVRKTGRTKNNKNISLFADYALPQGLKPPMLRLEAGRICT
jgi:hypothetical protein